MVKTAWAVLIFFSLFASSPYSLPSPPFIFWWIQFIVRFGHQVLLLALTPEVEIYPPPATPHSLRYFASTWSYSSYDPPLLLIRYASPPGGVEGKIAKEDNVGRDWLSPEAKTVDGGVAVGLWLCSLACNVKKEVRVIIKGASARTFITRPYGKLCEHVA